MLVSLSVQNYALIKRLRVDFTKGYSVITGETGAGKSILLGALGLVLGNRADLSNLKDKDKKCVIEAEFEIGAYALEQIFENLELDYEQSTIVRRELLPNGKTRAFVNDTPVNLKALQGLKEYLLDIHSQHNTMALSDKHYQYYVVDALADNNTLLVDYKLALKEYKKAVKELKVLKANQQEAQQQYEYNLHLYKELQTAKLKEIDEIETLEVEIEKLSHAEDIKIGLFDSLQVSTEEQIGLQTLLNQLQTSLSKIAPFDSEYKSIHERAQSLKIELDDLVFELEKHAEGVEANPEELEALNDRLSLLFSLQKKHFVTSLQELIAVRDGLAIKVGQVEDAADLLAEAEKNMNTKENKTFNIASKISSNRKNIVANFKNELELILSKLGMENAQFNIAIETTKELTEYGIDDIAFLLASNKGSDFGLLKKVASGGELSRVMLGIKMILSKFVSLPTILFDEIDTGVSGEVATKIADLMKAMGDNMQVITITHLPQVASKGQQHYKVYKQVEGEETVTYLTQLDVKERVNEIAEMLGGKEKSQSAIEHAEQLLSI
ncbi:DNA repair protein RecN (Recombination protein N) [Wenyingzhuangia heitensis]|uniref:DNA repair protein RecN n=1 Tax=Wenyingzhuangia heitensis TaxID=1487859 RepID=A0ABX0U9R8_9FLAO|nr:DNA repair protein RecN [Wenyingzhuangia heitensis]NIJ44973.1 DNA repair protein RecN (Recombination protein N) [Wenyingzhuangia heitensis]